MPQISNGSVAILKIKALQKFGGVVCADPFDRVDDRIGRAAVSRERVCHLFRRHRRHRKNTLDGARSTLFRNSSHEVAIIADSIMKIRINKLHPQALLPEYAHGPLEDAGMDVRAREGALLEPNVPQAIPTGLALEIPAGYEVQIRPRSGLALKHAITLPNSPATIDPGYRGELKVILLNLGKTPYQDHAGDRIAQMVVARYEAVEWEEGELADSTRGTGGFGSSGR